MKVCRKVSDITPFSRTCSSELLCKNLIDLLELGEDPQVRGDAFKTLFVARLSYETTENDLRREFERFGPIERVCSLIRLSSPIEIFADTS